MRVFLVEADIPTGMRVYIYGPDEIFGPWLLRRLRGNDRFDIGGFIGQHNDYTHEFPIVAESTCSELPASVVLLTDIRLRSRFLDFSSRARQCWCLNAVPYTNLNYHEYCLETPAEALRLNPNSHVAIEVKAVVGFARRFLEEGAVAFDIGANTGGYIPTFRQLASSVHAFEPTPWLAAELREIYSGRDDIIIIGKAVSDHANRVPFYLDNRGATSGSSLNPLSPHVGPEPIMVETVRVDDYCEETGVVPNFIKIDVETHEVQVIEGAWTTIERYQPVLIFEFWEAMWKNGFDHLFDRLSTYYKLIRTEDWCDALDVYQNFTRGDGVYNIGCVPFRNI